MKQKFVRFIPHEGITYVIQSSRGVVVKRTKSVKTTIISK